MFRGVPSVGGQDDIAGYENDGHYPVQDEGIRSEVLAIVGVVGVVAQKHAGERGRVHVEDDAAEGDVKGDDLVTDQRLKGDEQKEDPEKE